MLKAINENTTCRYEPISPIPSSIGLYYQHFSSLFIVRKPSKRFQKTFLQRNILARMLKAANLIDLKFLKLLDNFSNELFTLRPLISKLKFHTYICTTWRNPIKDILQIMFGREGSRFAQGLWSCSTPSNHRFDSWHFQEIL